MRVIAIGSTPVSNRGEAAQAAAKLDHRAGIPVQVKLPDNHTLTLTIDGPKSGPAD